MVPVIVQEGVVYHSGTLKRSKTYLKVSEVK